MSVTHKRILVVTRDAHLRETRVMLLRSAGYTVISVSSDDDALRLLETDRLDLVLLGRSSGMSIGIDQRLRERYPSLLTLKIDDLGHSEYATRMTDSAPEHVIHTLKEMLAQN
jgi:DNA-binding NtrC family response regulator